MLRKSILLTLSRQVFGSLISFAAYTITARALGPVNNGTFSIAILIASTLAIVFNFGISSANVFFINKEKIDGKSMIINNAFLWLCLSLTGIVIGLHLTFGNNSLWLPNIPQNLVLTSVLCFPTFLLHSYLLSILQGNQNFVAYNVSSLLIPVISLIFTSTLLLLFELNAYGAFLVFVVSYGSSALVALFYSFRSAASGEETIQVNPLSYSRKAFSYAWKAHVSNVLTLVNYRADLFLINLFLSSYEVGLYAVSIQLAERVWMLSYSVSVVALPKLSQLNEDEEQRKHLTPKLAHFTLLGSAIISLPMVLFSHPIILVLFGTEFEQSAKALIILLPGVVLLSFARILANDIASRNRPDINMNISLIVSGSNIILNLFLIPKLGISGAAVATTTAYLLNTCLSVSSYACLSKNSWYKPFVG